jgi:hypothetical protein
MAIDNPEHSGADQDSAHDIEQPNSDSLKLRINGLCESLEDYRTADPNIRNIINGYLDSLRRISEIISNGEESNLKDVSALIDMIEGKIKVAGIVLNL